MFFHVVGKVEQILCKVNILIDRVLLNNRGDLVSMPPEREVFRPRRLWLLLFFDVLFDEQGFRVL